MKEGVTFLLGGEFFQFSMINCFLLTSIGYFIYMNMLDLGKYIFNMANLTFVNSHNG